MSYLCSIATAFPSHLVRQDMVARQMVEIFDDGSSSRASVDRIFQHARVIKRSLMRPLAWYTEPHSHAERNRIYLNEGTLLLEKACRKCLTRSSCTPEHVDHLITVSSTGLATPSLDARLIEKLGLRREISRVPVWGLGCAGGVMGMAMALDYCRAYPDRNVMVAALETCSLTFQKQDLSRKNLVGTALFGDGAAAALVCGRSDANPPVLLRDHTTYLYPESERIMGWDIVDEGFELVLSATLPALIHQSCRAQADAFLKRHNLHVTDLQHLLLHPGGPRVLDAVLDSLAVDPAMGRLALEVLADFGNLSSVSIFAVLEKWLSTERVNHQGPGLMLAFGPGFSSAMLLFEV